MFGQQGFGQAAAKPAGFSFGQPQQQTQQQPQASGSLFGSQPQNTGFGQTQNTGFGQQTQQPQQQQQPASGGLFGSTQPSTTTTGGLFGQKPAAPTGGLFGSTQSTTQPAQQTGTASGGLFGNTQQQQPQQQQSSLFGQPQSQQPQQQTGGLFGAKPATTGGLFGQPQAQTSGFGNTTTGGLFGSQNTQQQPQQQTGSLFGTAPKPAGGLFGQPQTSTQPTGGLFGGSTQQPQLLGQQQQQQQQPQAPYITPFTRPSDLPEAYQKELEAVDMYIRLQSQTGERLAAEKSEHGALIEKIPKEAGQLRHKLVSAIEMLKYDDAELRKLRKLSEQDYNDTEKFHDILNATGAASVAKRHDKLLPYFKRVANVDERLEQLAAAAHDVNHGVASLEFGSTSRPSPTVTDIIGALQDEYDYFMSLSDRVAELHRNVEKLK